MELKIIRSNRGTEKLCYQGYTYTKKTSSKSTIRWECARRRTFACFGAIVTDMDKTEVRSSKPHAHEADPLAVEILKVRSDILASVPYNTGNPAQIIADVLTNAPVQVRSIISQCANVRKSVRRAKAKAKRADNGMKKEPNDRAMHSGPTAPFSGNRSVKLK